MNNARKLSLKNGGFFGIRMLFSTKDLPKESERSQDSTTVNRKTSERSKVSTAVDRMKSE